LSFKRHQRFLLSSKGLGWSFSGSFLFIFYFFFLPQFFLDSHPFLKRVRPGNKLQGHPKTISLSPQERHLLRADQPKLEVFARLRMGPFMYTSPLYTRMRLKCNGTIAFELNHGISYGDVHFYLAVNGAPHAVVTVLRLTNEHAASPSLQSLQSFVCPFFPVSAENPLALVPAQRILGPCITIRSGTIRHFVMRLVNHHELRF